MYRNCNILNIPIYEFSLRSKAFSLESFLNIFIWTIVNFMSLNMRKTKFKRCYRHFSWSMNVTWRWRTASKLHKFRIALVYHFEAFFKVSVNAKHALKTEIDVQNVSFFRNVKLLPRRIYNKSRQSVDR